MPEKAVKKPRKRAAAQPESADFPARPWGKQPSEPSKAFVAFAMYRDLGVNRKMRYVQANTGIAAKLLAGWKDAYNWDERAQAYDEFVADMRRVAHEQAILKMGEAHLQAAEDMARVASKALAMMEEMQAKGATELTPADVARFMEVSSKVGRLALGLPSRISEDRNNGLQGSATLQVVYVDDWRSHNPSYIVSAGEPQQLPAPSQGTVHDDSLEDDDQAAPAGGLSQEEVQRNRRAWEEAEKSTVALSASENKITTTQAAIIMATPRKPKLYLD